MIGTAGGLVALSVLSSSCAGNGEQPIANTGADTPAVGTEADNPFHEPAGVSPCKGKEAYNTFKMEVDSLSVLEGQMVTEPSTELLGTPDGPESNASTFVSAGPSLSDPAEGPIWLECVEWHLEGEALEVQNLNFSAACGADWIGGGRLDADELLVHLRNGTCAVAVCGSCNYDLRTHVKLEGTPKDVSFQVELDTYCDGELDRNPPWLLPLASQLSDMRCKLAHPGGARKAFFEAAESSMKYLYADCSAGTEVACSSGTECIDDRCLLPCSDAAPCPLSGALLCTDGYCRLPE